MADQRVPHISEANPDPESDDLAPGDAGRRMAVERAQRSLELSPRRALAGGYRRGDVDQLLGRASRTIDQYARRINELQLKLDGLASRYAELEGRYQQADGRSPQEVAGDMLAVAQRAIEQVKENARVEAASVVTAARGDAERILGEAHRRAEVVLAEAEQQRAESEGLRRETQSAIEAARHEAQTLHEAVEREKEQLLSDALTEVERMRSGFAAEKATLEQAIADQQSEWERFVSEALARIEIIDPETVRAELRGRARDRPMCSLRGRRRPNRSPRARMLQTICARGCQPPPNPTSSSSPGNRPSRRSQTGQQRTTRAARKLPGSSAEDACHAGPDAPSDPVSCY